MRLRSRAASRSEGRKASPPFQACPLQAPARAAQFSVFHACEDQIE